MIDKSDGWLRLLEDPILFQKLCWPDITLYDKQREILHSVRDNDETIVPAGNALGKDFVSALCALWFFCSRSPCRVVTSSVDQPQLKGVLWGEIRRFVQTSRYPLPIQMNDLMIRQIQPDGTPEPRSYLIGRVTAKGEGLLGHHIEQRADGLPRTLALFDECSGIENGCWEVVDTWAHRKLAIGNPYPCTNFFFRGVKDGDVPSDDGRRYYRKIVRIRAVDSPNIRLAERQIAMGREPTLEVVVPGVADYPTYLKRRKLWDEMRQSIGLDAEFYEGAEVRLYPPQWLDRAARVAEALPNRRGRSGRRTMGVDAAEGGDSSVWTVCDRLGVLHQLSLKTKDTATIQGRTLALMKEWDVRPEDVLFDRGGGGKQHADYLRRKGYEVRTVGFGEAATDPKIVRRMRTSRERMDDAETRYVYKNRRAEMYGLLRLLLDPDSEDRPFGIPDELDELRRQLAPMPLMYDDEGRLMLPPKDKKSRDSNVETIREMLGRSPDEADSLVLAVFGLLRRGTRTVVRAVG